MWLLKVFIILCSGVLINCKSKGYIEELKLEVNNGLCKPMHFPILKINQKFKLSVKHKLDGLEFERCYSADTKVTYNVTFDEHFTSNDLIATVGIRNVWVCNFYTKVKLYSLCVWNCKTYVYCSFYPNITREADMGYFTINGEKVTNVDKSKPEVGTVYYDFCDGDQVKVGCYSTDREAYSLTLSYTTKENQTFSTGSKIYGPVEMYIKLAADNDGVYVNCHINNTEYSQDKKLYFKLKEKLPTLGFQVNGLTLTATQNNNRLFFYYEYYDGENLEIASFKDQMYERDMECVVLGKNIPHELHGVISGQNWHNSSVNITTTLVRKNELLTLDCGILVKRNYRDTSLRSLKKLNIVLNLVPTVIADNEVFITGLSMTNILLQFKKEHHEYIVYEQDFNKTLTLTSYSNYSIEWFYDHSEMEYVRNNNDKAIKRNTYSYFSYIESRLFKLYSNGTSYNITCHATSHDYKNFSTVYVTLMQKKNNYNIKSTLSYENTMTKQIIAVAVAAGVIFLVLVLTVLYLRKRKQTTPKSDSIQMICHTSSQNKQEEMPVLSEYATPFHIYNSDTYSTPYVPNTVQEMYTKPIPKHLRQNVVQPTYAELSFTKENKDSLCDSAVGQGLSQSDAQYRRKEAANNYVQVIPKSKNSRALLSELSNEQTYVNCQISNNTYVNTSAEEDYVEPAYCEVIMKK